MKAYPVELRERVVAAAERREGSIEALAKTFLVGTTFVYKMLRQKRENGSLAPKPHGGGFAPTLGERELKLLRQWVQEQPDATLEELRQRLRQRAQIDATLPMVCRALQKLNLRRKRKKFFAQERNPKKRRAFWRKVQQLDPQKLVFVDEMGANIDLSRRYARAPGAQRVEEPLPRNTPSSLSVLGALGARKVLAMGSLPGAVDAQAFAVFIKQLVVPQLQPGDTVLMDNVPAHGAARVEEVIESAGAQLLNLPPYSPDFDPLESGWSKLKAHLRKVKARTQELLAKAIAAGAKLITPKDIRGWYVGCGYIFAPN